MPETAIDIEDLMVLAGIVLFLAVAFHRDMWTGLMGLSGCLIIAGLALGKAKTHSKGKR